MNGFSLWDNLDINMDNVNPFSNWEDIDWDQWEEAWAGFDMEESMKDCAGRGLIQCSDGSCAETSEDCPDLVKYSGDTGRRGEGLYIDNPETLENERLKEIYDALGGYDYTGMNFNTWSAEYGDDFPEWEGSIYEDKFKLIDDKLSLLPVEIGLTKDTYNLQREEGRETTNQDLSKIRRSREQMVRQSGGLGSGFMQSDIQNAYESIGKGFDFISREIDLKEEASLIDFETKTLDYEMDLTDIVGNYQDAMTSLISSSLDSEIYKAASCDDNNPCADPNDVCVDGTCVEDPEAAACKDCNIVMSGIDELTPVCINSSGASCPDECCQ